MLLWRVEYSSCDSIASFGTGGTAQLVRDGNGPGSRKLDVCIAAFDTPKLIYGEPVEEG
jgi:hypothetical protein